MGIGGCAGTYGKVPDTRPKAGDANGASPGSDQEALTDPQQVCANHAQRVWTAAQPGNHDS